MGLLFMILGGVFMLAVLGSMLVGFASMAQDTEASRKRSNSMMWWRVRLQAAAVICLLIGLYFYQNAG